MKRSSKRAPCSFSISRAARRMSTDVVSTKARASSDVIVGFNWSKALFTIALPVAIALDPHSWPEIEPGRAILSTCRLPLSWRLLPHAVSAQSVVLEGTCCVTITAFHKVEMATICLTPGCVLGWRHEKKSKMEEFDESGVCTQPRRSHTALRSVLLAAHSVLPQHLACAIDASPPTIGATRCMRAVQMTRPRRDWISWLISH